MFDDSDPSAYYSEDNPYASVKVAGHGVTVTVTGQRRDNLDIAVVNPAG